MEPHLRRAAARRPRRGLRVPSFTDVLADFGITFRHHFLDSETGSNYQINPYDHGSGVAIADLDGDGLEDVTERAGLAVDRCLSVGVAFGDYDGDGDADLYDNLSRWVVPVPQPRRSLKSAICAEHLVARP